MNLDNGDEEDVDEEIPKVEISFNSTFEPAAIFSEVPVNTAGVADEVDGSPKVTVPKMTSRRDSKGDAKYDVEEIRNKIIAHITRMSSGKKMNLINMGSESYDEAIHQIQKNERLAIIRALRDTCSDQPTEASTILNSIIPDMDIKIEDLPADKREELSSSLKIYSDEVFGANEMTVDPHVMFQQAQEMLSGLSDDIDSVLEDVNVHNDDTTLCNMELSPLNTDLLSKNPIDDIDSSLNTFIEPLEDPAAETLKIRELLNEPVISSDMNFRKKPTQKVISPSTETGTPIINSQRALKDSYKQFEAEIFSSLITFKPPYASPTDSERYLNDTGRFKANSFSENGSSDDGLLPVDFNFSSSYLNFKNNSSQRGEVKDNEKKQEVRVVATIHNELDKRSVKSERVERSRKHSSLNCHSEKGVHVKIKSENKDEMHEKKKMSLDERIAKELQNSKPHREKDSEHHRKKYDSVPTTSKKTRHPSHEDSTAHRSSVSPEKSYKSHDFLQPRTSQRITETSDLQRKKMWRSPGEKKFMSEQRYRTLYEHSDTELDFSGTDTEDENRNPLKVSVLKERELKNNLAIDKNKHARSPDNQKSNVETDTKTNFETVMQLSKTEIFSPRYETKHLNAEALYPPQTDGNHSFENETKKRNSSDNTKLNVSESEKNKVENKKRSSSYHGHKTNRNRESTEADSHNSRYFLQSEANAELHSVSTKNPKPTNVQNTTNTGLKHDSHHQSGQDKKCSTSQEDTKNSDSQSTKKSHSGKIAELKSEETKLKLSDKIDRDRRANSLEKANVKDRNPALTIKEKDRIAILSEKHTRIHSESDKTQMSHSKNDKIKNQGYGSKMDTTKNVEDKTKSTPHEDVISPKSKTHQASVSDTKQKSEKKFEDKTSSKEVKDELVLKSEETDLQRKKPVRAASDNRSVGDIRKERLRRSRFSPNPVTPHSEKQTENAQIKNENKEVLISNEEKTTIKTECEKSELHNVKRGRPRKPSNTSKSIEKDSEINVENSEVTTNMNDLKVEDTNVSVGPENTKVDETTTSPCKLNTKITKEPISENVDINEKKNLMPNEQISPEMVITRKRGRPRKSITSPKTDEDEKDSQNKTVESHLQSASVLNSEGDFEKEKSEKLLSTSTLVYNSLADNSEKVQATHEETAVKHSEDAVPDKPELGSPKLAKKGRPRKRNSVPKQFAKDSEKAAENLEKTDKSEDCREKTNSESAEIVENQEEKRGESDSTQSCLESEIKTEQTVTEKPVGNTEASSSKKQQDLRSEDVATESISSDVDIPANTVIKTEDIVSETNSKTVNTLLEPLQSIKKIKMNKAKRGRFRLENKKGRRKTKKANLNLNSEVTNSTAEQNVTSSLNELTSKSTTELETSELKQELVTTKPELQKDETAKTDHPKKRKNSAPKLNFIKDQEAEVIDSKAKIEEATTSKPATDSSTDLDRSCTSEENSSKRRSSTRIKRLSKSEFETDDTKPVEAALPDVPMEQSAKRKKVAGTRKSSKDLTAMQPLLPQNTTVEQNQQTVENNEKSVEIDESVQVHKTRSNRVFKQREVNDDVFVVENTSLAPKTNLIEDVTSPKSNVTEVRKEKRKLPSKKSKKASKRRALKVSKPSETDLNAASTTIKSETDETSETTEAACVDVKMEYPPVSSPGQSIPNQTVISSPQGLLRVKSLAQLLPESNQSFQGFAAEPTNSVGPSNSSQKTLTVVDEPAKNKSPIEKPKQKQNLRKRKLSDEDQLPRSKKQKIATKDAISQTEPANTSRQDSFDVGNQTNMACSNCKLHEQNLERRRKWIDELRKFDETIQSLLLAKAEIYDKLLSTEKQSKRVARKRTVPHQKQSVVRKEFKDPPGVQRLATKTKKHRTSASVENPLRTSPTAKVLLHPKFLQPCQVHLYKYTEKHIERMKCDRDYLLYEENRRYRPDAKINIVSKTEPDGISNLRIVSVTSLAITEPENVKGVESAENTSEVQKTMALTQEELSTMLLDQLTGAVLVLKASRNYLFFNIYLSIFYIFSLFYPIVNV